MNGNNFFTYVNGGKDYKNILDSEGQPYTWYVNIFYFGRDYLFLNDVDVIEGQHCSFVGKIKSVRIYNKALTEEISHNYRLDNERYKIE